MKSRKNGENPPAELSAEEQKRYCELVSMMGERRDFHRWTPLLSATARTWLVFDQTSEKLGEVGLTYEHRTKDGAVLHRPRPEVKILEAARRDLRGLLSDLGLTPRTAERVPQPAPTLPDDDKWAEYGFSLP